MTCAYRLVYDTAHRKILIKIVNLDMKGRAIMLLCLHFDACLYVTIFIGQSFFLYTSWCHAFES